jgi:Lrp/AsnC family leucine-responsive transcriptional regulator
MPEKLDDVDLKILDLLQRDAHMTNQAIAQQVDMTAPSVFERIRKLEQRGVIRGYATRLDPAAFNKTLTAFIRVTAAFDSKYDAGVQSVIHDPDVLECYSVAGEDCFIIKTRVGDPGELEALIKRIRGYMTVQRSVTMIVLSALKEDGTMNILPVAAKSKTKSRSRQ